MHTRPATKRRRKLAASPYDRTLHTAQHIENHLQHSYPGWILPDDDAGREDAELMLEYLAHVPHAPAKIETFLTGWCPWMDAREREQFTERAMTTPPPRYTADELAERLGVTYAERQARGYTLIGSIDADKTERARRRKERDRERSRRRKEHTRRNAGRSTREQYLADAAAKRQQWEMAGVSRATWYRQQARGENATSSVRQVGTAASFSVAAGTTCLTSPAAAANGSRKKKKGSRAASPPRPSGQRTHLGRAAAERERTDTISNIEQEEKDRCH